MIVDVHFDPIFATLATVVLLLGATLLIRGLIGRRAHDHPICRLCKFDLIGHDSPKRCPECGADLTKSKRAIRNGLRKRRPAGIVLGLLLITLVCAPTLLAPHIIGMRGLSIHRVMPLWFLNWSVQTFDSRDAANEIFDRYERGSLSNSQVTSIVDLALAVQADRNREWVADWGRLVGDALASGDVSDEQWNTFLQNGLDIRFEVSNPITTDGRLAFRRIDDFRFMHGLTRGSGLTMAPSPRMTKRAAPPWQAETRNPQRNG